DPQSATVVAPRTRRHSTLAPASALNDHDGLWPGPGDAGHADSAGAAGATVSSVYALVATAPTLPAASVARTENVYVPSGSSERSKGAGLAHGAQSETVVAPRTSWHSTPAPASALNAHSGERSAPGDAGGDEIDG